MGEESQRAMRQVLRLKAEVLAARYHRSADMKQMVLACFIGYIQGKRTEITRKERQQGRYLTVCAR